MFSGKKITLIVCGSIAAYKSAELVRALLKANAAVSCVMTEAAQSFITPLTLQTLSRNPVTTKLIDEEQEAGIGHIKLADEADLVLVAPATADILAKSALGLADDVATAILLATKAPVLFAPAMNVNMWENAATKRNIEIIRRDGRFVVEPESGELACGWYGSGRLAETDSIVHAIKTVLGPKDLTGIEIVVTAGPTQERIDPIRFVSNRSTGKMGYSIARIAQSRGAQVKLVSGPSALQAPHGIEFYPVTTARQMKEKVFSLLEDADQRRKNGYSRTILFMAAAVTDHRPEQSADQKIKNDKAASYLLEMTPNPDILAELGNRAESISSKVGHRLTLVGFNAETGSVSSMLESAREKLKHKRLDLIVSNLAEDSFGKDTNRVWLVDKIGNEQALEQASKDEIADKIISKALTL